MDDIKLDDFKIGEVYGFIISNDQGESEEIKGCVTGHNHMQLEDAQADLIIIRNILNKIPKGYDKILDALIFDVCGFGR